MWRGNHAIFRRHFAREIAAYDVQTKRCDTYGQDAGYGERVMLIYDGLHYDALAVSGSRRGLHPVLSEKRYRDIFVHTSSKPQTLPRLVSYCESFEPGKHLDSKALTSCFCAIGRRCDNHH